MAEQIVASSAPLQTATRSSAAPVSILARPGLVSLLFALAALALLLPGLATPKSTFFDELYFVPEARALIQGVPNPTPYVSSLAKPPLGKIIMALGMRLFGDNSFGWRIASAVCGAFTVTAVFLWTWLLLRDMSLAALAAALALLNNFLFVMSRIATVDTFLLFFLMWSLVALTASLTLDLSVAARRLLFCTAGALVGLAGAVKWNAIDTLAAYWVMAVTLLYFAFRSSGDREGPLSVHAQRLRQIGLLYSFIGLLLAPILFYSLTFRPICRVLQLPFTPHEIASINAYMWRFNKTTAVNPLITMPWYNWPLNLHPQRVLSYLVGNPVVTWGGLGALAVCAGRFLQKWTLPEGLVALLFSLNFLQWVATPQKGLYYYYYYPCVMFLGVAIAIALRTRPRLLGVRLSIVVLFAAAFIFARCYPQMAHLEAPWDCLLGCFPFY